MREVKISPSPALEIYVHVSEQMEEDFWKCRIMAAEEEEGPDCEVCSWRDSLITNGSQGVLACTLLEVKQVIERRRTDGTDHMEDA